MPPSPTKNRQKKDRTRRSFQVAIKLALHLLKIILQQVLQQQQFLIIQLQKSVLNQEE
jgi:hypothetical protein